MQFDFTALFKDYQKLELQDSMILWLASRPTTGIDIEKMNSIPTYQELGPVLENHGRTIHEFKKYHELNERISFREFSDYYLAFHKKFPDISELMKKGVDPEVPVRLIRLAIARGHLTIGSDGVPVQSFDIESNSSSNNIDDIPFAISDPRLAPNISEYAQWACTWQTSIARATFLSDNISPTSRILFLGDDDFTSIALGRASKINIHVVEIDARICDEIKRVSETEDLSITIHQLDLKNRLPDKLRDYFDAFVCDPIYTPKGFKLFLNSGWDSLIKEIGAKGYISISNRMVGNATIELQRNILDMGFHIERIVGAFNQYPTSHSCIEINVLEKMLDLEGLVGAKCIKQMIPFVYTNFMEIILTEPSQGMWSHVIGDIVDYIFTE